ncbi:MAG: HNH endonuclease [Porticoccus sp.]|nr:HNH endonuclease [Porticoccus sp.]MBQ0807676.1 HNH endonuclease [Porticoccus sp.]
MAISPVDTKILWGRAGGRCSEPGCDEDLTSLVETGNYLVGEMAHIIGDKPTAARGKPEGGSDTYDNLILLCPTHHTHIDKSPEGTYSVELLHDWKRNHEALISNAGKTTKLNDFNQVRIAVARILAANKAIFDSVGPSSSTAQEDPSSNAYLVWELRRIDRILPNNQKILNILDTNIELIEDLSIIHVIESFRVHVESYEKHVYHRLDSYQLFPNEFSEVFS